MATQVDQNKFKINSTNIFVDRSCSLFTKVQKDVGMGEMGGRSSTQNYSVNLFQTEINSYHLMNHFFQRMP